MATILIADDDRRVRDSIDRALRLDGHDVIQAPDGAEALRLHEQHRPDVVLLDVSMPNVDGLSVCRKLRSGGSETAVIMLTARHEVSDRVAGLDAGADDYLVKPFSLDELQARVRAQLRRLEPADDNELQLEDLHLDLSGRRARRGDAALDLSKTEFDLLEILLRNPGRVMTRASLYDHVWDGELDTESKTLDVYVGYLRRKTEVDGASRLLHTVRGVGYVARRDDG